MILVIEACKQFMTCYTVIIWSFFSQEPKSVYREFPPEIRQYLHRRNFRIACVCFVLACIWQYSVVFRQSRSTDQRIQGIRQTKPFTNDEVLHFANKALPVLFHITPDHLDQNIRAQAQFMSKQDLKLFYHNTLTLKLLQKILKLNKLFH